jgi:hypothetical protein
MDKLEDFTTLLINELSFKKKELGRINLGLPGYQKNITLDEETKKHLEKLLEEDIKLYKHIIDKHSGLYSNISSIKWQEVRKKCNSLPTHLNKSFEGSCSFTNVKTLPLSLSTSEAFAFNVTLKNTSDSLWTSKDGSINLSYHWLDSESKQMALFEGIRTPLDQDIQLYPGESITTRMKAMTPKHEGNFLLQLVPIKTKLCWFELFEFDSETRLFKITDK